MMEVRFCTAWLWPTILIAVACFWVWIIDDKKKRVKTKIKTYNPQKMHSDWFGHRNFFWLSTTEPMCRSWHAVAVLWFVSLADSETQKSGGTCHGWNDPSFCPQMICDGFRFTSSDNIFKLIGRWLAQLKLKQRNIDRSWTRFAKDSHVTHQEAGCVQDWLLSYSLLSWWWLLLCLWVMVVVVGWLLLDCCLISYWGRFGYHCDRYTSKQPQSLSPRCLCYMGCSS